MTTKQTQERARRLQQAMFPLCGDSRFLDFVGLVKELKEEAIRFAITHDNVKDARATTRTLGEIAAYEDILGIVDNYREQQAEQAERAEGAS